jgi:Flp pilus assembly protein TadG
MLAALRNMKSGSRFLRRSEKGQAQVEFALTILFVLLLLFGIIELIMMIYTYTVLANSAKEGVRYAIVHGCDLDSGNCSGTCVFTTSPPNCTDATGANVQAWVVNYAKASLHDTSAMTINVTYPDSSSVVPSRVRVTVTYNYQPLFGMGWPTVPVHAAAEGRIVY